MWSVLRLKWFSWNEMRRKPWFTVLHCCVRVYRLWWLMWHKLFNAPSLRRALTHTRRQPHCHYSTQIQWSFYSKLTVKSWITMIAFKISFGFWLYFIFEDLVLWSLENDHLITMWFSHQILLAISGDCSGKLVPSSINWLQDCTRGTVAPVLTMALSITS